MCVIIPCFNEELSITSVIESLKINIPSYHLVVINDGSLDRSSEIAKSLNVVVVDHPTNLGIGASLQTGLIYAKKINADIAIQFDADGQHLADEILNLLQPIFKKEANFVIGTRWIIDFGYKSSFPRKLGIVILSFLLSKKIKQSISDPTSGFRAMDRKTIDILSNSYSKEYPEVSSIITAKRNRLKIIEVPVAMKDRAAGVSSISSLRSIYYMILEIFTIVFASTKGVD